MIQVCHDVGDLNTKEVKALIKASESCSNMVVITGLQGLKKGRGRK